MGAVFDLRHATVGYGGRPVLADIDLTVQRGERVAIMGRSGAGKSTLIRLLFAQRAAEIALIPQPPPPARSAAAGGPGPDVYQSTVAVPFGFAKIAPP